VQLVHDVDVSVAEYFPAMQSVQLVARPSIGLYFPAAHTAQEVWAVRLWALPPGQSEHTVDPLAAVNWPDKHDVHEEAIWRNQSEQNRKMGVRPRADQRVAAIKK